MTTLRKQTRGAMKNQLRDRVRGEYSYSALSLPNAWDNCIEETGVSVVWDILKHAELVTLYPAPDDMPFDDLYGDAFDPSHADTIPGGMRALKAQEKKARERLDAEGQWYHEVYYRTNSDATGFAFKLADSIGGFVGDDLTDSGYIPRLYMSAFDGLADAFNTPRYRECCFNPRKRPLVFLTTLVMVGVELPEGWHDRVVWA